jgi:fructose-1,6-bisphosphatase I
VRKITRGRAGEMEDMLQPGRRQVAAGYILYGSSTMLVYTTGQGAHGFTYDPSIGEFLLSHPDIRIPTVGRYLSVNDSYEQHWEEPVKSLMRKYRGLEDNRRALNVRYVGSLVADFHRNLLGGGVFCYPSNRRRPEGKLRLLYEANPLAFIVEQAGGAACDGRQRILDIQPTELHQRTPLYIGGKAEVALAHEVLSAATAVSA